MTHASDATYDSNLWQWNPNGIANIKDRREDERQQGKDWRWRAAGNATDGGVPGGTDASSTTSASSDGLRSAPRDMWGRLRKTVKKGDTSRTLQGHFLDASNRTSVHVEPSPPHPAEPAAPRSRSPKGTHEQHTREHTNGHTRESTNGHSSDTHHGPPAHASPTSRAAADSSGGGAAVTVSSKCVSDAGRSGLAYDDPRFSTC